MKIALLGATGRMGRAIAETIRQDSSLTLAAISTHEQHANFGHALFAPELILSQFEEALSCVDVAIDFSTAESVPAHLSECARRQIPYLCGVTGLAKTTLELQQTLGTQIPIFWAPNMSVGVTLCLASAESIATHLGGGFTVAIHDIHHAAKRDAPSGTALEFGRVINKAVGDDIPIHYSNVREGSHPGEHHIQFRYGDEVIEIRHKAGSRDQFALGAVRAARWLVDQPPGLYNMRNLLKITTSA